MTDHLEGVGEKAIGEFLSEAQEIVENLNRDVLQLDDQAKRGKQDQDLLNNIFRAAHSLKGLSGMFGIKRIADCAHTLESLLDLLRMGKVPISSDVVDALFESIELFNGLIAEASGGTKVSKKILSAWQKNLEKVMSVSQPALQKDYLSNLAIDPAILGVLTEYEEYRLIDNVRRGTHLYKVHAAFDLMNFDESLAHLSTTLKSIGELVTTLPSPETARENGIDFDLIVGSEQSIEQLNERVGGPDISITQLNKGGGPQSPAPQAAVTGAKEKASTKKKPLPEPEDVRETGAPMPEHDEDQGTPTAAPSQEENGEPDAGSESVTIAGKPVPFKSAAEKPAPETAAPERELASLRSVSQTVRVDIRKLDILMNIVGELVLVRTAIQSISDQLKAEQGFTGLAVDLYKEVRNFERKLDELQVGIMEVRMVPLGQNFEKLSRMVRKISRSAGKEVELRISGAETELDKLIVEDLADPLMHILRNAIDHGIESPEERIQAGKPTAGIISVRAYQKGNHVVIEVADDGKGIDLEEIRSVALEKGLLQPDHLDDVSRRDLMNMIFLPGFSTSKKVSELSGRGVGLDVVKTNIANLSGMIDLESTVGKGTRIVITLPITLAIIRALIIRVSEHLYAIPLNSVLEIFNVDAKRVRTIERREVIELRGNTLPLLRLSDLFELTSSSEIPPEGLYVVVVGLAQNRLGIIVDGLVGQQDIVIKSLGRMLSGVPGIAGATNLASQQTILVLDVGALIEETLSRE